MIAGLVMTKIFLLFFFFVLGIGLQSSNEKLISCQKLNGTYDGNNPYPNCTNDLHFEFSSLFQVSRKIYDANPYDWRLAVKGLNESRKHESTLSYDGCIQLANTGYHSYTPYQPSEVWTRLVAWKFPLFQLLATFPGPPFGFVISLFVALRLLGNPMGVVHDLILKFASCQARAQYWKHQFSSDGTLHSLTTLESATSSNDEKNRLWKAFSLIIDSYDEWGQAKGNLAQQILQLRLEHLVEHPSKWREMRRASLKAAYSLAADRTTKTLPIVVAQPLFIESVGIAFGRTVYAALDPAANPGVFVNIEAHSIAFTALYFWVIFVTFVAALIGTSQTADSIPRILSQLEQDLRRPEVADDTTPVLEFPSHENREFGPMKKTRQQAGGIYCWQPLKLPEQSGEEGISKIKEGLENFNHPTEQAPASSFNWIWICLRWVGKMVTLFVAPGGIFFPICVILFGVIPSIVISARVSPTGLSARHIGEIPFFFIWLLSFGADFLQSRWTVSLTEQLFYHPFKDFLATAATLGIIFATQAGIFNSCWAYTHFLQQPLALPEIQPVKATLASRIQVEYPAVAFSFIACEFVVFPAMICWRYADAIRVFIQRDDGKSNVSMFRKMPERLWTTHIIRFDAMNRQRQRNTVPDTAYSAEPEQISNNTHPQQGIDRTSASTRVPQRSDTGASTGVQIP